MSVYVATEPDVSLTINDFAAFCAYLEEKKPKLTRAREELGKKDCFAINGMLSRPRDLDAPKYLQPVYLTVHLFFHIALETGLFVREARKNGDVYLVPSLRLKRFKSLNPFAQYMFLFRTFWTKLDYETLYRDTGAMFGHFIYMRIGLTALKEAQPGKRVFAAVEDFSNVYNSRNPIHRFFVSAGPIIHHLRDFGFWDYEEAYIRQLDYLRRNDPNVKAVTPTAFGTAMIPACLARPYEVYSESPDIDLLERCWHEDHLVPILEKLDIQREPVNVPKEPFEKAFEVIFPPGAIDSAVIDAILSPAEDKRVDTGGNVYVFKVSLNRSTWRRVKISASHTLDHLHQAIQDAFGFYNDHLYAFFMSGKPWSGNAYWSRGNHHPPYTDKAVIGRLNLIRKQKLLYLYDFGDEWKFTVLVEEILQSDVPPTRPLVIESKGEAPDQYDGYWD